MTNIEQLEKAMQEAAEAGVTMLKKSQMSFDFTSTNPHQPHHNTAYQYANNKGTVVNVAAKVEVKGRKIYLNGQHHAEIIGSRGRDHKGRPVSDFDIKFKDGTFLSDKTQGKWVYMVDVVKDIKANPEILGIGATQEQPTPTEHPAATAEPAPRPTWDSDAAVNDTKDIKRRLVAAGFKPREWSVTADIIRTGARTGEIGDAKISHKYPLTSEQVISKTDSLLDAGFDVTWNTTKLDSGKRITQPTINSVGRKGELKILDADKPIGQRISLYDSQAEAQAALDAKPTAEQEHDRFWRDYKNVDLGKHNHLKEDMAMDGWDNAQDAPDGKKYEQAMAYFDRIHDESFMREMYGDKIK